MRILFWMIILHFRTLIFYISHGGVTGLYILSVYSVGFTERKEKHMGIEIVGSNQSYQPNAYQSAPVEAPASSSSAPEAAAPVVTKPLSHNDNSQIQGENGKQPSDEEVKAAINQANKRAKSVFGHANAEFSYHEATKRISVKIVDKDTNEVIREIPPEKTLDMISKMWELAGIVVDEKR